ncbi:ABC transporter ATP-binding protein, partial [Escherichia coli]|uniref:ABC transporter ATP-binding protein n=1 Tax=Escherichia coli TaxID=562 RepID=UPI0038557D18|nr:ABC transporter ATP-binding protein [Escherichia coli]
VNVNGRLAALLELGSGFNPEFTGRENVYLNGYILGFTHEQMKGKFSEIESFADIGDHIDQPVKTYSSGMAVRLAFAVQACIKPDVLIVDEALAVGDEKFQRKCFEYIESLRENGCSILLVTHSTSTVEKFCQRAVLL